MRLLEFAFGASFFALTISTTSLSRAAGNESLADLFDNVAKSDQGIYENNINTLFNRNRLNHQIIGR
ncbi:MAG: hypothetical protein JWO83_2690 [Caulobacteraceae bacterium]|jgi:hypothetical protein|nr:hypothetical protein [Caulobacteraceae bacterium]